eukprot:TRINITY_DN2137_c0_g1::TRINITY_DN2137_c0_g1_i1::g.12771::m.12771 TRINITY_DN2137_c0_g1::TRINITY_DN2137_c0_g1_i1::g.12771  ORF type:complete len:870 (+),score=171.81,sp/Q9LYZ9/PP362_ARATH/21.68/9e-10,PPR_2/PF13041.1/2.3e+02,PPR_2/PF13041.1/1.3e+02,PPR_2/PF13041.1/16,PPR_2/PF13041.1/96,PPR_2/PF13041.1/48,PPR_2/PF13041.1/46,PPR_2/PF13041.1/6.7e+03,PPR_3/PF13812.1/1.2e+03,PPR_3/PF13812.1/3.4e+03,PPR_3/PF13812.1/1.9e+03,PPR_3/PF13812.1/2.3,PPR_3/PF13812.1/4.6,PPR_3/PF13812.1/1.8e+03,PPR_3/PF13812.1/2.9
MVGFPWKTGNIHSATQISTEAAAHNAQQALAASHDLTAALLKLSKNRDFAAAAVILRDTVKSKASVPEPAYNNVLSSCAEAEKSIGVVNTLNVLIEAGVHPFASTWISLTRTFINMKAYPENWKVIQYLHSYLTTRLQHAKSDECHEMIHAETQACTSLLDACMGGGNQQVDLCFEIMTHVHAWGTVTDVAHYRALILKYLKLHRFNQAVEVAKASIDAGVRLDEPTYALLAESLVIQGDKIHAENACDILMNLQLHGNQRGDAGPYESSWTALLNALLKTKRIPSALTTFHRTIVQAHKPIHDKTHILLIQSLVQNQHPDDVLPTFTLLQEHNFQPSSESWTAAITALLRGSYIVHAKQIIHHMAAARVCPEDIALVAFMEHQVLPNADIIIEILDEIHGAGIPLSSTVWQVAFSLVVKNNLLTQSLGLLSRMQACKICPDEVPYRSLTLYCIDNEHEEQAMTLVHQVRMSGYRVSDEYYKQVIEAFMKKRSEVNIDRALSVVTECRLTGNQRLDRFLDKSILATLLLEEQIRRETLERSMLKPIDGQTTLGESSVPFDAKKRPRVHSSDNASQTLTKVDVTEVKIDTNAPNALEEAERALEEMTHQASRLRMQWNATVEEGMKLSKIVNELKSKEADKETKLSKLSQVMVILDEGYVDTNALSPAPSPKLAAANTPVLTSTHTTTPSTSTTSTPTPALATHTATIPPNSLMVASVTMQSSSNTIITSTPTTIKPNTTTTNASTTARTRGPNSPQISAKRASGNASSVASTTITNASGNASVNTSPVGVNVSSTNVAARHVTNSTMSPRVPTAPASAPAKKPMLTRDDDDFIML